MNIPYFLRRKNEIRTKTVKTTVVDIVIVIVIVIVVYCYLLLFELSDVCIYYMLGNYHCSTYKSLSWKRHLA